MEAKILSYLLLAFLLVGISYPVNITYTHIIQESGESKLMKSLDIEMNETQKQRCENLKSCTLNKRNDGFTLETKLKPENYYNFNSTTGLLYKKYSVKVESLPSLNQETNRVRDGVEDKEEISIDLEGSSSDFRSLGINMSYELRMPGKKKQFDLLSVMDNKDVVVLESQTLNYFNIVLVIGILSIIGLSIYYLKFS